MSLVPVVGIVSVVPVAPVSACSAAERLFATHLSDVSIPHSFSHCPCSDTVSRVKAGLDGSTDYLHVLAQHDDSPSMQSYH